MKVSLQNYDKQPLPKGVKLIDLDHFYDDGGSFMEIIRLCGSIGTEESKLFPVKLPNLTFNNLQLNYSYIMPGVVKAFHLHKEQTDVWFIPPFQRVLIGLFDTEFPVTTATRLVMGIKPQLLVIPPGIAHGIKNISDKPAHMIYLVDRFFNPKDEYRIDWDWQYKEFWEVQNG